MLRAWAAPGGAFPDAEASRRYRAALQVWPAPHCALEYHRWFVRSRLRPDGRRYSARMRTPIAVPVLQLHGAQDGGRLPHRDHSAGAGRRRRCGTRCMTAAGHFPHEETPDLFNAVLLDWLGSLT